MAWRPSPATPSSTTYMARNDLLSAIGDALDALTTACGYNLRRSLDAIRRRCALVILVLTTGMAKFDTWSALTDDLRLMA
ncbi:MAG: hypothetical protein AAGA21_13710 [Pseudomonadota bacterium]